VCAAAGLLAARHAPHVPSWAWFAGAFVLAMAGLWPPAWRVALGGAVALLGGGWLTLRVLEAPVGTLLDLLHLDEPVPVVVEGIALSSPRESRPASGGLARFHPGASRWRFECECEGFDAEGGFQRAGGRLYVHAPGETPPPVRAGDRVRLTGTLAFFHPPRNPGEEDIRLTAAQRGFVGVLSLSGEGASAVRTERGESVRSLVLRAHDGLRRRASEAVDRALRGAGEEERFLVRALVLGDYDPAHRPLREVFARQGLAHALSISGFHLTVMAAMLLFVLRLTGDRGWVEPALVGTLVVLYALVVPPSSPILRSAVMVLVLLISEACGRRYDRVTVTIWVALALLAWRPMDLWSPGYQFSAGLTAALLWVGQRFHARLWGEELRGLIRPERPRLLASLLTLVKQSVSAAVLCWILSTPVLLCRFGLVSPLAILVTVLVTPVIVVLLWSAYAGVVLVAFVPATGHWTGAWMEWLGRLAIACVRRADGVSWSALHLPPVGTWWAGAAVIGALALVRWGDARRARWWVVATAIAAWMGAEWTIRTGLPRDVLVRVDMFDVGDGTRMLVRSGRDAMLWDTGGQRQGGLVHPAVASCRALGAWVTPTLVITHPDLDHFESLEAVVGSLGVRRALVGSRFLEQAGVPGSVPAEAMGVLARHGVEIVETGAGDAMTLGDASVVFVSPPSRAPWAGDNDHSLVALVEVESDDGVRRVLLTGDVEDAAIEHLGHAGPAWVDVLELPHHGSARPAAIGYSLRLNPSVVLQSTGRRRLDDPRWEALRDGRVWLVTARNGWCWVEVRLDGRIAWGSMNP
jgi:competence protein ComEC